jgi:hypothetical protein
MEELDWNINAQLDFLFFQLSEGLSCHDEGKFDA